MRFKRNFKMGVISIVLLITGSMLIACGKTKEEKAKELLSEYADLVNEEGTTEDPKKIINDAYDKTFKNNKNGWNDGTNKVYTFGDFTITLPEYFKPNTEEAQKDDKSLYWEFGTGDHTLLTLKEGYYQKTKITGDILETIYNDQKSMYKEFDGPKPIYSEYNDKTDLIYYTASVKLNDGTKARSTMALYVMEDRTMMINLLSKMDAQYDYSDDFINIMTHVK